MLAYCTLDDQFSLVKHCTPGFIFSVVQIIIAGCQKVKTAADNPAAVSSSPQHQIDQRI
jgi:hypothetical protein